MNPVQGLLRSRKFLVLVLDTVISTVLFFVGRYAAPEMAEDIGFLIASLQPVMVAVIGAIAYEDAAAKRAQGAPRQLLGERLDLSGVTASEMPTGGITADAPYSGTVKRAEERHELVVVIERNTNAWHEAALALAKIAEGMAILVASVEERRRDVGGIRTLLARRPCVADEAVKMQGAQD